MGAESSRPSRHSGFHGPHNDRSRARERMQRGMGGPSYGGFDGPEYGRPRGYSDMRGRGFGGTNGIPPGADGAHGPWRTVEPRHRFMQPGVDPMQVLEEEMQNDPMLARMMEELSMGGMMPPRGGAGPMMGGPGMGGRRGGGGFGGTDPFGGLGGMMGGPGGFGPFGGGMRPPPGMGEGGMRPRSGGAAFDPGDDHDFDEVHVPNPRARGGGAAPSRPPPSGRSAGHRPGSPTPSEAFGARNRGGAHPAMSRTHTRGRRGGNAGVYGW